MASIAGPAPSSKVRATVLPVPGASRVTTPAVRGQPGAVAGGTGCGVAAVVGARSVGGVAGVVRLPDGMPPVEVGVPPAGLPVRVEVAAGGPGDSGTVDELGDAACTPPGVQAVIRQALVASTARSRVAVARCTAGLSRVRAESMTVFA